MKLSIVIPAYNEQACIKETLTSLLSYCKRKLSEYEVIVVDDGSTDETIFIVEQQKEPNVRLLHNKKNMGKGYSVKKGILAAKYPHILFMDGDLATPVIELDRFIPLVKDYDIIIASRNLPDSNKLVKQPFYRDWAGKIFPFVVRLVAVHHIRDTQCGFKLFKTSTAKKIVKLQTLHRWAFDVEILFIAQKMGIKIKELPVTWISQPDSKLKFVRDSFFMFYDVLKIRWNNLRNRY